MAENTGNNAAQNATANKSSLFREKNLERLESPEKLNDYLRVTSPGVWMVLGAVIVLLIGVCIWGIFGRIQATTPAVVITESGESSCLVPQSALEGVLNRGGTLPMHHSLGVQPLCGPVRLQARQGRAQ